MNNGCRYFGRLTEVLDGSVSTQRSRQSIFLLKSIQAPKIARENVLQMDPSGSLYLNTEYNSWKYLSVSRVSFGKFTCLPSTKDCNIFRYQLLKERKQFKQSKRKNKSIFYMGRIENWDNKHGFGYLRRGGSFYFDIMTFQYSQCNTVIN